MLRAVCTDTRQIVSSRGSAEANDPGETAAGAIATDSTTRRGWAWLVRAAAGRPHTPHATAPHSNTAPSAARIANSRPRFTPEAVARIAFPSA
jgi:hypothetical protein